MRSQATTAVEPAGPFPYDDMNSVSLSVMPIVGSKVDIPML